MTGADRPLNEFTARPGQTLRRHIEGVAAAGDALADRAGQTPYGDDWTEIIETLAWTHDIGKLTEYFQNYIETLDRSRAPYRELTYHGFVGALLAAQALSSRGCAQETVAVGFYAVAKHHSVLQNIPTEFRSKYAQPNTTAVDKRFETAETQLSSINNTAATAADHCLHEATNGALGWEGVPFDNLSAFRRAVKAITPSERDSEFYGCVLRAWSMLVTADKFDASGITTPETATSHTTPPPLPVNKLTEHIREISDTRLPDGEFSNIYLDDPDHPLPDSSATTRQRLNALRTRANGRAAPALRERHAAGERLFRLTLPTGFGKTFTGLRAALTLVTHLDSRVVYALPYTSIIDQVDEEIQKRFCVDPSDPEYTKHHHLADTRTILGEDSEVDRPSSGRDTMHAEAWRARLVLTTFSQLFESAAGPGNIQSMKLPALQDSVIILDEPQAVSLRWWELTGRLAAYLTEEYNAMIVFMTATQPRILDRLDTVPTPTPLIETYEECLDLIEAEPRVEFSIHRSLERYLDNSDAAPLSLADAADELRIATTTDSNALAVVNTVESAATLSDRLTSTRTLHLAAELVVHQRETDGDTFDADDYLDRLADRYSEPNLLVTTLTTRLRPADREAILDVLRRILDDEKSTPFDDTPTIAVSTQLIEAGVDVSFNRLYRDFAPLPSIVQAAGRCNREFGDTTSTVTIWRLDSPADDDYIPSQLIYQEGSLLRPTRGALETLRAGAGSTLGESTVIDHGVDEYYDRLHEQRRTGDRQDELVTAFDRARGEQLRKASLIEQRYPTQDILVLVAESDHRRYREYIRARDAEEWQKARQKFQQLKQSLVSVPATDNSAGDLTVVRPAEIDAMYDPVSGRGPAGSPTDSEV